MRTIYRILSWFRSDGVGYSLTDIDRLQELAAIEKRSAELKEALGVLLEETENTPGYNRDGRTTLGQLMARIALGIKEES